MLHLLTPFAEYQDVVLLVIRIIAGATMVYYGWPKIRDLKSNAEDFVGMGWKPGWFWGTIGAFTEFVGGILVLLGWWIWLPAALFGTQMILGTIWKITKVEKPFTDWSYDLLLLALMLVFLVWGAGSFVLG